MACTARDGEITVIFLTYQAKVTPTALNARLESILKQLAVNLRDGNVSHVVRRRRSCHFGRSSSQQKLITYSPRLR